MAGCGAGCLLLGLLGYRFRPGPGPGPDTGTSPGPLAPLGPGPPPSQGHFQVPVAWALSSWPGWAAVTVTVTVAQPASEGLLAGG